nr:nicotinate (nicotinamide) nucleotide adenylyltransferase [bacterium endosymbiont of Pedicinus badii]
MYGGTFDPIHIGHISCLLAIKNIKKIKKTFLIINKKSWYKKKQFFSFSDRIKMLKIALSEISTKKSDFFTIYQKNIYEKEREYTINIANYLQKKYKNKKIVIFIGLDSFINIKNWYLGKKIVKNFEIFIFNRIGYKKNFYNFYEKKYEKIRIIKMYKNVSSSVIRKKIQKKKNYKKFLTPSIYKYIKKLLKK